ncbi:hypothetical protein WA026_011188 [Henosepilachna vigintioctopunctata]|uniref:Uncharacterized protein n=1 Tax=Henosepilachna vigintioctopunctata TaxID=420089 RepID=A0AAW1U779_9CUCU
MLDSEFNDSNASLSATLLKFIAIRKYSGNNIEPVAFDLYKCLSTVAKSDIMYMYLYLKILHNRETDIKIPKHFQIIFMSSLRHLKIFSSSDIDCIRFFIYLLVKDIFANLDPLDFRTIYLLKVLNQVVLKSNWVIDIYQLILSKLYTLLYATPLTPLKSLSLQIINNIELNNNLFKPHLEPYLNITVITNFENSRSRFSFISNYYIMQNIREYMKFIHKFFHFNVHNRAAGIVYKCIISRFNIQEFQEYVWPFWKGYLEKEIEEREFSQSLVKYWIPYTVDCYGIDIFTFFSTQEISRSFLLLVIYELRRKRHISVEYLYDGIIFETLLCCAENKNTFEKSMEICCTFPVLNEKISEKCFDIIEKYFLLNNYSSAFFEKHINRLLTHIFISEHVNSLKPAYKFVYDDFISKLSNYITRNLTTRKSTYVSIKLCMNLVEIMKKPSKDFKLSYDLPKKFAYGFEENRYYLYLHKNGIFDLLTTKKILLQMN